MNNREQIKHLRDQVKQLERRLRDAIQPKTAAGHTKNRSPEPEPQASINREPHAPPAASGYYNADNQDRTGKRRLQIASFVLEVAGFFVLGSYVIATWKSLEQLKQQTSAILESNSLNRKANELSNRAYVAVSK